MDKMNWLTNYLLAIFIGLNIPFFINKQEYIGYYILSSNVSMSIIYLCLSAFSKYYHHIYTKYQKWYIYLFSAVYFIWNTLYIIYLHHHLIDSPQYFYLITLYGNDVLILLFNFELYNLPNYNLYAATGNNILPIYSNQL